MAKKLYEMTLVELWQLFPIFLTEPQPQWRGQFDEECTVLTRILPDFCKIHHIGSTAIDGIWAKPIVDILVEVPVETDFSSIVALLTANGYTQMSQSENRISFNKGYTEKGFAEKVFHLHLRRYGDNDELYFRDYLNEFTAVAKQYEELKLNLCEIYKNNRDGYTDSKTEFVKKHTQAAKALYKRRYD